MSCQPDKTIYRLLDAFAGWDEDATQCAGVVGFQSPRGLRLKSTGNVDPGVWTTLFLPPRLAWSCRRCEWLLATPEPARLLALGQCRIKFELLWDPACAPVTETSFLAVASRAGHVALASADGSRILHFDDDGRRLRGTTSASNLVALAYTPNNVLVAACQDPDSTLSFLTVDDQLRESRPWSGLAVRGRLLALRVDRLLRYWFLIEQPFGPLQVYSIGGADTDPTLRTWRDAVFALDRLAVRLADPAGFCIERARKNRTPDILCFDWYGRCAEQSAIVDASPRSPDLFERNGEYGSLAIDSGVPECQWHRIQLDLELPPATHVEVFCASSEDGITPQAAASWWSPGRDVADFLVRSPQGRYLHLRILLSGDGRSTPRISRVRAEFPRTSTLDHLPPVYRNNIRTDDFTERFLSLFDTLLEQFDSTIEQSPALLDTGNAPDEVVRWLCTWLDVGFDVRWSPAVRRRVLQSIPSLYSRRGTPSALREAVQCVLGRPISIEERGPERAWGSLSRDARLDSVRLFGRSIARVRLGTSALGRAPIRSFGNPDRDPLSSGAFRFRVLAHETAPEASRQLAEIVSSQKPAHTVETIRAPGDAWIIGLTSAVGVDTQFVPLPAPVLGSTVRLRRTSVLARGRGPSSRSIVAGARVMVGVDTRVE
jgi:phage tail-like protein